MFRYALLPGGVGATLARGKGTAGTRELRLGEWTIPYSVVKDTWANGSHLALDVSRWNSLPDKLQKLLRKNDHQLVLRIRRARPLALKRRVDRARSVQALRRRHAGLSRSGQEGAFRAVVCPECSCAVDLSRLPETAYIYCPYCGTVFLPNGHRVTRGSAYRPCRRCGMFDRIHAYAELYIYIVPPILSVNVWQKRRWLCPLCAAKLFWKVLLLNAPFVLGIVPAVALGLKSLSGRDPYLCELPRANALALKGRWRTAEPLYERLRDVYCEHPGVLTNEALGHLKGGDPAGAVDLLRRALRACANYQPARELLREAERAARQLAAEQPRGGSTMPWRP